MEKVKLEGLDLVAYQETLKNGLEVVFIPYEDKANYYMSYATRFGSETTTFTPAASKDKIKVPDGIAHFLEHKMFEQENGEDPFAYFSKSGTGANASTSFTSTQYICYGTKNFLDNLRYLIQYVNAPYYTEQNVEKEKGIIAEELKMYEDLPDWKLENRLRQNIYHVHPRRVDIGGSVSEINKITKEDLYLCYHNFYSPNNMFLLIVGNIPMDEALTVIHEELDKRENLPKVKIPKIKEAKAVVRKEDSFTASIKVPKIGMGLKIAVKELGNYGKLELDLYLSMLTTMLFGSSSEFRERVRSKKLLNSLYTEWESTDDYRTYLLLASTDDADALIQEVKEEFKKLELSEDVLTRMKKVWIANEVKMADYIESTMSNVYDDMIRYCDIIPNKIEMIRNLKLEELKKIVAHIDFDNMAVVKMLPQES